jgi:hypothetical protein
VGAGGNQNLRACGKINRFLRSFGIVSAGV